MLVVSCSMKIFKSSEMKQIAQSINSAVGVSFHMPGGDYDTVSCNFSLPSSSDVLFAYAFRTDGIANPDKDNCLAEFIVLSDSSADSRGGIQTINEDLAIFATQFRIALKKLGWSVVDSMDDYF